MALDGGDAVWLVGGLDKVTRFGGTPIQPVIDGPGYVDAYYLVKLNPDGTNAFTKAIRRTDSNLLSTGAIAIALDTAGNAYVVGSVLLAGDVPTTASTFVTKFSPSGTQLVDRTFPGIRR